MIDVNLATAVEIKQG